MHKTSLQRSVWLHECTSTYFTFPSVLRHGGHDGPEAGGVVDLVAVFAGDGAGLVAGGRGARLAATHLAHAARATRPARPHAWIIHTIYFIQGI